MSEKSILCVGGTATSEWQLELAGLQSKWPDRVQNVCSEEEALDWIGQKTFSCVIVFPNFPGFSGSEFLLRLSKEMPSVPIILFMHLAERTQDGIVGREGGIWIYQRSSSQESHLADEVAKIINGETDAEKC